MSALLSLFKSWKPGILRFLTMFLLATGLVLVANSLMLGTFHGIWGKTYHTLLGLVVFAAFLQMYRNNRKDLVLAFVLWFVFTLPLLITMWLQPGSVTRKALCENNTWSITLAIFLIVATSLTALVRQRWLRRVALAFVSALWVAAFIPIVSFLVFLAGFGALLSQDEVIAMAQTNLTEAWEYLMYKGTPVVAGMVLGLLGLLALCVAVFRKDVTWPWQRSRVFRITVSVICCFAAFASWKAVNNVTLSAFYNAHFDMSEMESFKEGFAKRQVILADLAKQGQSGRNGLFVFVIGESHTRDRMSAYTLLARETTPWQKAMRQDDRFIMLEKGYSSYVATIQSLAYALTTKTQYATQHFDDAPSIVEVVKASGYTTHWLSNQNEYSPWDTPTTIIASCADHHVWLNSAGWDENLLKNMPVLDDRPTVVFIHMAGSHANYVERYPPAYKLWDEKDRENAYDNSLRYNDWVLSQIYEKVKGYPNFQAMVYMADHGENPKLGHHSAHFTESVLIFV